MKMLRLYLRVLELLGREARLGWLLAIANLALASAMFVEPILFGRIVDTLANAQGHIAHLGRSIFVPILVADAEATNVSLVLQQGLHIFEMLPGPDPREQESDLRPPSNRLAHFFQVHTD